MARSEDYSAKASSRLKTALELQRTGVAMMRQSLLRRYPSESELQIRQRLANWLQDRPGAEFGDGVGRPVAWPRPGR